MRPTLRLLTLCVLATLVWRLRPQMSEHWQALVHRWQSRRSTEHAVRSTAYPLDASRWLDFDLPPHATGLRLLTNAALSETLLPPIDRDRPRRGWKYAIDFQLLDYQGTPDAPRRYHFRTRASHGQSEDGAPGRGNTWFQDVPLTPAETRTLQIPLAALEIHPRRIRIRLASHDEHVQEVFVRVYFKHERPDYEQPYTWSRLPHDAHVRLCRASVYPPDLLTPREKRNLLRRDWTALAPRGLEGVHYEHRLIYQKDEPDTADLEFLSPPEGVACRPNRPVTIATPQAPGRVQLSFFADHKRTRVERAAADLWIHRRRLGTIAHHQLHPDDLSGGSHEIETAGDLLEIVTNDHLICVAKWRPAASGHTAWGNAVATDSGSTATQTTPSAAPLVLSSSGESIRACLLEPKQPVSYTMTHVNGLATPLRVTLRSLSPRPTRPVPESASLPLASAEVIYEFLDVQQRIVRHGTLRTSSAAARYDHASIGSAAMQVGEPVTFHFAVPIGIAQVRFYSAHGEVAVIAFTRPADLARRFRIPEEQGFFRPPDEIGRTWFIVQPDDYRHRVAANRCVDLYVQTRPPAPHKLLIAGRYDWDDHRPREFVPGRFALTPRDESFPVRDEAVLSTYYSMPLGQAVRIHWRPDGPDRPLEPRLIYLAPRTISAPIRVWIDEKLHFEFVPRARHGEIKLPAVSEAVGVRTVRIAAAAETQIYLRNIRPDDRPAYTKRFVYQIDSEGLTFDVVKHSDDAEPLVLRTLFVRNESDERLVGPGLSQPTSDASRECLQVRLTGIESRPSGPLIGWTLEERIFEIDRGLVQGAVVLSSGKYAADGDASCTIVMGKDLKPGTYQLHLRHLEPAHNSALVSLYRIRPPKPSQREVRLSRWSETDVQPAARPPEHREDR